MWSSDGSLGQPGRSAGQSKPAGRRQQGLFLRTKFLVPEEILGLQATRCPPVGGVIDVMANKPEIVVVIDAMVFHVNLASQTGNQRPDRFPDTQISKLPRRGW